MSGSDFSSQKLTIAWATRVSFAQLGARLISYIETRASITTFRLAARYTPSSAFCKLPEELVLMIANEVSDQSFRTEMKDWVQASDCLANRCTSLSHIGMVCPHETEQKCRFVESEVCQEESMDDHFDTLVKFGNGLLQMDGTTKIAKYTRAFTREFGVRPYFLLNQKYEESCMPSYTDAKGYLIIPLTQGLLQSSSGEEVNSFTVDSILNPKMLTDLTEDQRRKITTAAMVLNLHAYDACEDESWYQDDLEVCHCSNIDSDECAWDSECDPFSGSGDELLRQEDVLRRRKIKQEERAKKQEGSAKEQKAKQDTSGASMEVLLPSPTSPQPKPEKKEVEPQLMMLGCGDYC
ncbi:MAG: hypothetical protein Q9180_004061 [Flavoplaca navasiana]